MSGGRGRGEGGWRGRGDKTTECRPVGRGGKQRAAAGRLADGRLAVYLACGCRFRWRHARSSGTVSAHSPPLPGQGGGGAGRNWKQSLTRRRTARKSARSRARETGAAERGATRRKQNCARARTYRPSSSRSSFTRDTHEHNLRFSCTRLAASTHAKPKQQTPDDQKKRLISNLAPLSCAARRAPATAPSASDAAAPTVPNSRPVLLSRARSRRVRVGEKKEERELLS